jgi:uncharacterized protein YcaQ
MSALDNLVHGKRELFEYWGHAACFLPVELYPLLRWRMENQLVRVGGARCQTQGLHRGGVSRNRRAWTAGGRRNLDRGKEYWTVVGMVRWEASDRIFFSQGRVAIAGRRNFERLYDLPIACCRRRLSRRRLVDARDARRN